MSGGRQAGMTLIELVISIVILGLAAATLYSTMGVITERSADPLLRQQSLAIAESYLEEVLLQAFADPDGQADCGRACFDDVGDYAGLNEAPHDARGNPIAALAGYRVVLSVTPQAWNGLPADRVRRVTVQVSDPNNQPLRLDGYKVDY